MCFKNPFKDKDDICFFAAIICTAIANGVAVGLPKSNILGLTAILAFALNMFIDDEIRHNDYGYSYYDYKNHRHESR